MYIFIYDTRVPYTAMARKTKFCNEKIRKMREAREAKGSCDTEDSAKKVENSEAQSAIHTIDNTELNVLSTARRKRKRQVYENASSMREAKIRKLDTVDKESEEPELVNVERITRRSEAFKKVESLFQPCIVNLGLLKEALQKCQVCGQGPLQLQNVDRDVEFHGS